MKLSDIIDFELATILDNRVVPNLTEIRYAVTECIAIFGDGHERYNPGSIIPEYVENIYGECVYAPTYAEVIDWLFENGFVIEFMPSYTFALKEHAACYFKVWEIDDEGAKLNLIYSDEMEMGSLESNVKDIVRFVIGNDLI